MHLSGNQSMVVVEVVHFLAVRHRHVLWGRCGAAILIGRCVSDGSFCVAAADVRAVQRVYGAVTEMSNKIYKEILKEILLSKTDW